MVEGTVGFVSQVLNGGAGNGGEGTLCVPVL